MKYFEFSFVITGFVMFLGATYKVAMSPPYTEYDLAIMGVCAMILSQIFKQHGRPKDN